MKTSIATLIALLIGLSTFVCNAQNEEFFIDEESPVIAIKTIDSTKTAEEKKISLVKENQEEFLIEEESPVVNVEKIDSMQSFGEKQLNLVKENKKNQIEEFQSSPDQNDNLKNKKEEEEKQNQIKADLEKQIADLKGRIAADSVLKELLINKSAKDKKELLIKKATKNDVEPPVVNNKKTTKKEKTAPVNSEKQGTNKVSLPQKGNIDIDEKTKTFRVRKSDMGEKKDEIKKLEGMGYKLVPMDR